MGHETCEVCAEFKRGLYSGASAGAVVGAPIWSTTRVGRVPQWWGLHADAPTGAAGEASFLGRDTREGRAEDCMRTPPLGPQLEIPTGRDKCERRAETIRWLHADACVGAVARAPYEARKVQGAFRRGCWQRPQQWQGSSGNHRSAAATSGRGVGGRRELEE